MKLSLRQLLALKFDSIILAAGSVLYGVQIFFHPIILETYKIYSIIRNIFDNRVIGLAFVILGMLKLIGIFKDNRILRLVAIRGLLFLWLLFLITFILTPPPNTVWVYSLVMVSLATGSSVKEG